MTDEITPGTAITLEMTPRLRFVKREIDNGDGTASCRHILQQAWVARETGEVYWQDVPVEAEGG